MESSRDSSVWRNLAVTFGGGLALGAVGMKLTQSALRPVEFPSRPDINPVTDRLVRMQRRLERMEHQPAVAPAQAAAQVDQKVLEAVVGAVDARLQEHAGQVERRLADLEARVTIELQTLRQQDRQLMDVTEKRLVEIQQQFRREVSELRTSAGEEMRRMGEAVAKTVAGQAAAQAELQTLHQQDDRIVDATGQRLADM